jgi:GTP-binding protein YchF
VIKRLKDHVEAGHAARSFDADQEEREAYEDLFLLSDKPVLYACNVEDEALPEGNRYVEQVRDYASELGDETVVFCAKLEEEMAKLDDEEEALFLEDLGVESTGLDRLIKAAYKELNLITFFTYNKKELKAWTVERGSTAPEAAGEIHTDFERGFIKAEVVSYETFADLGSDKEVRNAGKMRQEGKDYIVKDGDIILFKFNV